MEARIEIEKNRNGDFEATATFMIEGDPNPIVVLAAADTPAEAERLVIQEAKYRMDMRQERVTKHIDLVTGEEVIKEETNVKPE